MSTLLGNEGNSVSYDVKENAIFMQTTSKIDCTCINKQITALSTPVSLRL